MVKDASFIKYIGFGGDTLKKTAFVLGLTLILVFGLATSAMAMVNYVHMNFSETQNAGCAACHITHAADAAKLLKGGAGGDSQTDACYVCHGENGASPFDVQTGLVASNSSYDPTNVINKIDWDVAEYAYSYAGAFESMIDWADGDRDGVINEMLAVKSAHNVEEINLMVINPEYNAATDNIPGGSVALGGTFKCGSCHDPHNADSAGNPRLLKKTLPKGAGYEVDITYNDSSTNHTIGDNLATSYNVNLNAWCAGCHDWLNQGDDSAKDGKAVSINGKDYYMHPMGIEVFTSAIDDKFENFGSGYALGGADKNQLLCITCHRVHGTTADAQDDAAVYDDVNGYRMEGSALLRFNDRGVCYNCHGAAEKNLEDADTSGYSGIGFNGNK